MDEKDFHPYGTGSWPTPRREPEQETDTPDSPRGRRGHWTTAAVLVAGMAGGLIGGAVAIGILFSVGDAPLLTPTPVVIETDGAVGQFEAIAEKVVPSVVNITVYETLINPFTGATAIQESGTGSGVIYREDGHIVTNNHVIEGAGRIIVTVGVEEFEAVVIGADPSSDLAVLKVEAEGLPAAEFSGSGDLRVGQTVAAVGSPFGLEQSVSSGIISALSRSSLTFDQSGVTAYTNLIQTDAAINPGNSGGALADEQGRVIGINTLIESPSGAVGAPQSAGIGFAIPADYVMEAADQLIAEGCVVHPYLGASTVTLDAATIRRYALPVSTGAGVTAVTPGSPAGDAGIEAGDIIVRMGERDITSFGDVFTATRENEVGTDIEVEIVRGTDRIVIDVTLAADTACETILP